MASGFDSASPTPAHHPSMPTYEFEVDGKWNQQVQATQNAMGVFLQRIDANVHPDKLDMHSRALLFKFVSIHQVAIQWYTDNIEKKRRKQDGFGRLTIILAFFIPLSTMLVPFLDSVVELGSPEVVAAQITGVITGLLAAHRALQTWFQQRNMIATWWRASADLKGDLYGLEDDWRGVGSVVVATGNGPNGEASYTLGPKFKKDLQKGIEKARTIIRAEKNAFYTKLGEQPNINLGGILSQASRDVDAMDVDALLSDLQPRVQSAVRESLKFHQHTDVEAELVRFDQMLEDLEADIKDSRPSEREKKVEYYRVLRAQRDEVEVKLIKLRVDGQSAEESSQIIV
ncbi:MAG: hypothetical protein AAF709_09715 [Pseudomonadota bacterium]